MPPGQHPPQAPRVVQVAFDAKYQAAKLKYVSWGHLVDGLIRAYGRERVREKLDSEVRRIRLGFHPVPLELMWMPEARKALDALEKRLEQRGMGPVGVLLLERPAIPALNVIPPRLAKPKRGRPGKLGLAVQFDDRE